MAPGIGGHPCRAAGGRDFAALRAKSRSKGRPAPRLAGSAARPHVDPGNPPAPLNPDYQPLWLALGHDPTGMDSLVERTGLTAAELSSMLLVMELDGRVAVEHGRYSRKS